MIRATAFISASTGPTHSGDGGRTDERVWDMAEVVKLIEQAEIEAMVATLA